MRTLQGSELPTSTQYSTTFLTNLGSRCPGRALMRRPPLRLRVGEDTRPLDHADLVRRCLSPARGGEGEEEQRMRRGEGERRERGRVREGERDQREGERDQRDEGQRDGRERDTGNTSQVLNSVVQDKSAKVQNLELSIWSLPSPYCPLCQSSATFCFASSPPLPSSLPLEHGRLRARPMRVLT